MTTPMNDESNQSVLREALRTIRSLKSRIAALESPAPVEIAIVGMAARFPGANTLKEFGAFLASGADAMAEPSADRLALWERTRRGAPIESGLPLKGGYIDWPVDRFDNDYFRISMREARSMDPQQRLLLELSIEALEHAGIVPRAIRGSATGIFYGFNNDDFAEVSYRTGNRSTVDTYSYTGNAFSVAAGRVSYALDLRGPNVALDTACSSSLVAIHLACKALASRECDAVLAGGVNLILSDAATTGLHRLKALSPDGHCWSFDSRANGFARAEGGGVLVLKRLDDAIAAGDAVHAVLLGGAVNHGGAAAGLTAPNGAAQAALLRAALQAARLEPKQVSYVEAHGTGTALGDPIEFGALADVFGGTRTEPLQLRSVKANVGHLEAAAGICGLIKMVLALSRSEIPPQANIADLNPALELSTIPAEIPRASRPWLRPPGGRRVGGVSSFGISGTNAHLIIADPPAIEPSPAIVPTSAQDVQPLFVVSGMTPAALREAATNAASFLESAGPTDSEYDIAFTTCARRDHHANRIAVLGTNRQEWAASLRGFLAGDRSTVVTGEVSAPQRAALLFGDTSADSDDRLQRLADELDARMLSAECLEVARARFGVTESSAFAGVEHEVRQFAVALAAFRRWERMGLVPDAVMGIGVGEIAAACAAGALTLENAVRLLVARGHAARTRSPSSAERSAVTSQLVGELGVQPKPRVAVLSVTGKPWEPDQETCARLMSGIYTTEKAAASTLRKCGYPIVIDVTPCRRVPVDHGMLATFDPSGEVTFLRSLMEAHCRGVPVLWSRYYARRGRVVPMPSYPWQRAHIGVTGDEQVSGANSKRREAEIVVLSAGSSAVLDAAAERLAAHLEIRHEAALGDVAYTLATKKAHEEHRLSLAVRSREELVRGLRQASSGRLPSGATRDAVRGGKIAFVFTGQGAQTPGMGHGLYAEWPVFRQALDDAFTAFDGHLPKKLRDVMWAPSGGVDAALIHQTQYAQPALFSFEVALAALWRSWGVRPDYVAGHSIGEIGAAYIAGVLSLEDAARLVAMRGRLMQALPAGGVMMAVNAPEADVLAALSNHGATVSIAAVNGPGSVVISGVEAIALEVAQLFADRGVRTKRLEVSHAFHSPLMDPMLGEFRKVAESIRYRAPTIPMVSNVTGGLATDELTCAEYWVRHVRDAVRFSSGIAKLHSHGVRTFLEIGPQGTLVGMVASCLPESAHDELCLVTSLSKGKREAVSVLEALGRLYAHGAAVEWSGVFQGEHHVVSLPDRHDAEVRRGESTGHPLLGVRLPVAGSGAVYESVWVRDEQGWLFDHRVAGMPVAPGAGVAETIRAAGEHFLGVPGIEVGGLVLQAPLTLPMTGGQRVQIILTEDGKNVQASLYSQFASPKSDEAWTLHATAQVRRLDGVTSASLDWTAACARCREAVETEAFYESAHVAGLEYGPAFRGKRRILRGDGEVAAEVELPKGIDQAEQYGVHPALLDAAFQTLLALSDRGRLALPYAIERFVVHQAGASLARVHAKRVSTGESSGALTVDITLADEHGRVVAEVRGLQAREVHAETLTRDSGKDISKSHLYQLDWPLAAVSAAPSTLRGRLVIVASSSDALAHDLVGKLTAEGVSCRRVEPGRIDEALPADQVICLWSEDGPAGAALAALDVSRAGLAVVQRLAKEAKPPRLVWVTVGGVPVVSGDDVSPALASIWGLGRAAMQEHPELSCTLIDVESVATGADQLLQELRIGDGEREIAWRSAERRVSRLVRARARGVPTADNYTLEIAQTGAFERLGLFPAVRRPPGPGEVEIAVRATGLNFRDVLIALGMYPGGGGPLGQECAGIVVAVGAGVERLAVGERVMAYVPGSFQRFVTVDNRRVAPIPAEWTLEQAAGVPLVFLTAWYALRDLAKLQRGERLVVHAAAGGVGMAAVQIAHWLGAKVFGTASASKWDVVRGLGVGYVASSRDLSFVDAFRAASGGEGVDVVLNSLKGEFIDKSASLLRAGGRFIEMGAVEIRDPQAMKTAFPGTSYRAFQLSDAGADRIAEMWRELAEGFASGHLKPVPVRSVPLADAEGAFRFMAQGRHVGKIVLTAGRDLRTDGTVLVTGGLGEVGLQIARSLAQRGVKHLVLTGRRGLETPGAREAVAALEGLGAKVTVAAVDVADREALERVLADVDSNTPLRGVVHAAGVLDDGMLSDQTAERFARVMSPKVAGACHLDALTRKADLDVFVMFSSVTGTLGNAGQGSYAAANAFLDALAARRQKEGFVGQSLAWGLWTGESEGLGMAAKLSEAQRARLSGSGLGPLSPADGIALFEAVLGRSEAHLVPMSVDVKALRNRFGADVPPVWRALVKVVPRAAKENSGAWGGDLAGMSRERREEVVLEVVRSEIARVLSLASAEAALPEKPLKELGLDSLMAVEVRNVLGKRVGATLPATLAFDYPTPAAITAYLLEKVLMFAESPTTEESEMMKSLEHVEAMVSTQLLSDDARSTILAKMTSLVAKLNNNQGVTDAASMSERIGGADDDELFKLLDSQFQFKDVP